MSVSYMPYEPRQQQLLPSALQNWLLEGHLCYFISDTIDRLNLSAFYARYAAGGQSKLHEDVAFRVLAAGNFPAHRTIRELRALHLAEFTELFTQVVRLARELGLVKLGTIALDGTKLKANASSHKAMSYGRMKDSELALQAQIEALVQKAQAADEAEKNEPELDIPAEIERRQDCLKAIQAAKARLEERQRQTDLAHGRSPDDERVPRDTDSAQNVRHGRLSSFNRSTKAA